MRADFTKNNEMPITKLIPSMLTLLALCIGLGAIRMAILGQFEKSIIMVMICGFLDGIDGRLARVLRATSSFGAELDSLCDFVNFGIAPSFILYFWYLYSMPIIGWGLVLLISMSLAIRLARFNSAIDDVCDSDFLKYCKKNFFVGVPAPVAGALFLLPLSISIELETTLLMNNIFLMFYLTVICFFAVSRIPTFSLKGISINRRIASVVAVGMSGFMISMLYEPVKTLIACCFLYITVMPFSCVFYFHKKRKFLNK